MAQKSIRDEQNSNKYNPHNFKQIFFLKNSCEIIFNCIKLWEKKHQSKLSKKQRRNKKTRKSTNPPNFKKLCFECIEKNSTKQFETRYITI
jgi:hypothetical protein